MTPAPPSGGAGLPSVPDESGDLGRSLFPEDSTPARAFDEVAATLAATKSRKRIKVL